MYIYYFSVKLKHIGNIYKLVQIKYFVLPVHSSKIRYGPFFFIIVRMRCILINIEQSKMPIC